MSDITNGNGKKVSWTIFVWVIGVVLLLFGVAFSIIGSNSAQMDKTSASVVSQVDKNRTDIGEIKVFIGATSESLKNINQTLLEIKQEMKK